MALFKTLEESLKTKAVVVISIKEYEHKGEKRNWIKVRKSNGRKVFTVAQYENGLYSEAA